ncbi:ABC transporter permease [Acuticoccus mangrovi]|uniref:ABC transporter permease n=1 Tax=Acuticoccus mangrovi TaxID=2796142 RepID=A0A934IKY5_9HYPH|nr:ABC transporter permease [Acuticoccus mangrovi]MBJ3778549.1 ABC transporter permease [Acuticoccus mangrovi]
MKSVVRRYFANRATLGVAILLVCVGAAVFAPFLANQNPYDLAQLNIMDSGLPPGSEGWDGHYYWLGTDEQGRDLLSAILYGLRVSLFVALASTACALVVGVSVGLFAAYRGGAFDALLMRVVDLQLSFPSILIALILLAAFGPGLDKVVLAITASQWAYFARTIRSSAQAERSREYIQAAQVLRYSSLRIMIVHLLPNSVAELGVVVAVEMASAVALEATLSFLGIGLPITQPSLGLLIANGFSFMLVNKYWISVFPGLVLMAVLISFNMIGEHLRKINEPGYAA